MSDDALAALMAELRGEFPRFRIVKKGADRLSRAIDVALKVLSFGRMRTYLTEYRTVIGDTLYVPDDWDDEPPADRAICLRHERVHLRQRRRWTMPLFAAAYLLFPLPVGLAYCRARFEWEAYRETLRATFELKGAAAVRDPLLRARMIERFAGPAYLWMWPFRAEVGRWYDAALTELGAS
jgi:hypothetical protein